MHTMTQSRLMQSSALMKQLQVGAGSLDVGWRLLLGIGSLGNPCNHAIAQGSGVTQHGQLHDLTSVNEYAGMDT